MKNLEIEYVMKSVTVVYNIVKEKDRTVKLKNRVRYRGWRENGAIIYLKNLVCT